MNVKGLTLATIIGLAVPAIATVTYNAPIVAQASIPSGTFEEKNN